MGVGGGIGAEDLDGAGAFGVVCGAGRTDGVHVGGGAIWVTAAVAFDSATMGLAVLVGCVVGSPVSAVGGVGWIAGTALADDVVDCAWRRCSSGSSSASRNFPGSTSSVGDRLVRVGLDVTEALIEAAYKHDKDALLASASRASCGRT